MFGVSNSGQGCALPTRILVHEDIYSRFVDIISATLDNLPTGDLMKPEVFIGPMVNAAAIARVMGYVDAPRTSHAGRLVVGGGRLAGGLRRAISSPRQSSPTSIPTAPSPSRKSSAPFSRS